jgi:uncharacterized protein (DUF488 family)
MEEFLEILREHHITFLADVRRFPGSRRHPQFGQDALAASLRAAGISYVHFPELGGRRSARKDSPNTAWRNAAFRGYADYMMTTEFHSGIERLLSMADRNRVAVMCAEAVWWQCHRSLIADFLKASGHEVIPHHCRWSIRTSSVHERSTRGRWRADVLAAGRPLELTDSTAVADGRSLTILRDGTQRSRPTAARSHRRHLRQ